MYDGLIGTSAPQNKYRQAYDLSRGTPPCVETETPEMIRIRKAQEQLSEVGLKMLLSSLELFV